MIDYDGVVVLQTTQRPTCDPKAMFERLARAGVIIIPNSDTPVDRLMRNFEEATGIKPAHLVAERGAVVVSEKKRHYYKPQGDLFKQYRSAIQEALTRAGIEVLINDAANWVRDVRTHTPNSRMAILDGMRELSFCAFFRRTDESGGPYIDHEFMQDCLHVIDTVEPPVEIERQTDKCFGIMIGSIPGVSKTTGFRILRDLFREPMQWYMIGDGEGDLIDADEVTHCAVGNAQDALIHRCAFRAKHSYTDGLLECLDWISAKENLSEH